MTLWDVTACDYPPELIGNLFPAEEMLFEYNGPLIFTFKTRWNGIAIAYLSDEDDNVLRYVIAPTNQTIVENLKSGIISLRNALDQPVIWLADVTTSDWSVSKCWQLQIKDLPEDAIPKPEVMLYPRLEQLRTIKTKDEQITVKQLRDVLNLMPLLIDKIVEEKLNEILLKNEKQIAQRQSVNCIFDRKNYTDFKKKSLGFYSSVASENKGISGNQNIYLKSCTDISYNLNSSILLTGIGQMQGINP